MTEYVIKLTLRNFLDNSYFSTQMLRKPLQTPDAKGQNNR